jgi:hypothetical protein
MADEEGGGKPATVVGGDPKKRKMMAIGIGVAALFVVVLMFGKKSSTASSGTTTNGTSTGNGVTADVAVPSGDVSTSDLMSQFATTTQAGNQALLQQMAGYLKNTNTNMPGGPPQPTGAQQGSSGGFWYTVGQGGAYLTGLAADAYRLSQNDQWFAPNDAFDASQIAAANPGLDISKQLQQGTQVYIPYLPGSPGTLSSNESYTPPASAYNAGPTGTQYHNYWPSIWTQQSGVNNLTLTQPTTTVASKTA